MCAYTPPPDYSQAPPASGVSWLQVSDGILRGTSPGSVGGHPSWPWALLLRVIEVADVGTYVYVRELFPSPQIIKANDYSI